MGAEDGSGREAGLVYDEIRERLRAQPVVGEWPRLLELADRIGRSKARFPFWEYPLVACQAGGEEPTRAVPAAAAVFCLVAAIRLVDDMLDREPEAPYRKLGSGPTANLALAFQALASRVLETGGLSPAREAEGHQIVARSALATAHGQHLDVGKPKEGEGREKRYWRIVEAKTPPLLEGGLALGGLHADLGPEALEGLRELGRTLGLIVQINDDLADAMETEATPDWDRPGNNLALLYALEADHPDRERFRALLAEEDGVPDRLEEAQRILVRSGAVSYCAHRLIEHHGSARRRLENLPVPDRRPLGELLERQVAPLVGLLRRADVTDPEALFR